MAASGHKLTLNYRDMSILRLAATANSGHLLTVLEEQRVENLALKVLANVRNH